VSGLSDKELVRADSQRCQLGASRYLVWVTLSGKAGFPCLRWGDRPFVQSSGQNLAALVSQARQENASNLKAQNV